MERLTIGAVSRRSGISIRMLRHYDHIGLVRPQRRPDNDYRMYEPDDIARIQVVVALRQLGFGLREISALLETGDQPLRDALDLRLQALDNEIAQRVRLRTTLQGLMDRIDRSGAPSTDELFGALEEMTTMERITRHYTDEQLTELAGRAESLGEAGMRAAEADWAEVMDTVRALMAEGASPDDPRAVAVAARWDTLVNAFTGGNPEIAQAARSVWETESEIPGVDVREVQSLQAYIASVPRSQE